MTHSRTGVAAVALLALALSGLLGGCGGGEETGDPGAPLSADEWRERAQGFCSDAYQEATALPLPSSTSEVAVDADSRAEIIGNVRDGLLTLGQPDGISSDDVSAYVDALNADISQLGQVAEDARGGQINPDSSQLDESAGQAAGTLGLDDCVALSEAIARTP